MPENLEQENELEEQFEDDDPEGEVGNESEELEPEDSQDEEDGEEESSTEQQAGEPDAATKRLENLENKFGEFSQYLSQLADGVKRLSQQPQPQPQPQNRQGIHPPVSWDEMDQRQLAEYMQSQTGAMLGQTVKGLQQQIGTKLTVYDQLFDVLLENHPNKDAIYRAVNELSRNPSMNFKTAFEHAQGSTLKSRLEALEKENAQLKRSKKNRRQQARNLSHRPSNVKSRQDRNRSLAEDTEEAMKELLGG